MPREATRTAIQTHFKENWNLPSLPVVFDNNEGPGGKAWGRLSIQFGKTTPATIGGKMTRTMGLVNLQVFLFDGEGTKPANDAADRITAIFGYQRFTAQTTAGGTLDLVLDPGADGPKPSGARDGYQQYNLSIAFRADVVNP